MFGGRVLAELPVEITNPNGSNPSGEKAASAADGNLTTKWLDYSRGDLVFEFAAPVTIDAYTWVTANDRIERDPTGWVFLGSENGVSWVPLDVQMDYPTPTTRKSHVDDIQLPAATAPVVLGFSASPPIVVAGQEVTLDWVRVGGGVG